MEGYLAVNEAVVSSENIEIVRTSCILFGTLRLCVE